MIKVLLVDDMDLIRKSIKLLIDGVANIQIIGSCKNGLDAVIFVKSNQPDIILMDIIMPVLDGFEATKSILNEFPQIKVIAHSSHSDETFVKRMYEAGAVDYIIKKQCKEELINSIHKTHNN